MERARFVSPKSSIVDTASSTPYSFRTRRVMNCMPLVNVEAVHIQNQQHRTLAAQLNQHINCLIHEWRPVKKPLVALVVTIQLRLVKRNNGHLLAFLHFVRSVERL